MATATRTRRKNQYVNRTQGFLGAVKINRKGDAVGVPVPPGERVFLTDEEVELTEQSHARAEDSPFKVREIIHRNPQDPEDITAKFTAALLEKVTD